MVYKHSLIFFPKVDTYLNILKKLNLEDKVIDYFKIDVEGSELNWFDNVFYETPHVLNKIKQIGMEVHPGLQYG